jgi:hypothetical protein
MNVVFSGINGIYEDLQGLEGITLANRGVNLVVQNSGDFENLDLSGQTNLLPLQTTVKNLLLDGEAQLVLADGSTLTVLENIDHEDNFGENGLITSPGKAFIAHNIYEKYCFQGLNVENVDLLGDAVINIDPQSTVVNAANWSNLACEEVIFVNFDVRFNCAGGITEFLNLSEGNISSYRWDFAGLGSSFLENPTYVFNFSRNYTISLEARGPSGTRTFQRDISVSGNTLNRPLIVANGSQLSSQLPAPSYQWYRNGRPIPGATERSFMVDDEGTYQVAAIDEQCNRISDVVVVSGGQDLTPGSRAGYAIGPNPVSNELSLFVNNDYLGEVAVSLIDGTGSRKIEETFVKNSQSIEFVMDFNYPTGLYLLQIQAGGELYSFKVLKE